MSTDYRCARINLYGEASVIALHRQDYISMQVWHEFRTSEPIKDGDVSTVEVKVLPSGECEIRYDPARTRCIPWEGK